VDIASLILAILFAIIVLAIVLTHVKVVPEYRRSVLGCEMTCQTFIANTKP